MSDSYLCLARALITFPSDPSLDSMMRGNHDSDARVSPPAAPRICAHNEGWTPEESSVCRLCCRENPPQTSTSPLLPPETVTAAPQLLLRHVLPNTEEPWAPDEASTQTHQLLQRLSARWTSLIPSCNLRPSTGTDYINSSTAGRTVGSMLESTPCRDTVAERDPRKSRKHMQIE